MKTKTLIILMLFFTGVVFYQCDEDDDDDEKQMLTQELLNKSTNSIKNFTGGDFAHGGPEGISADSTIREVYASVNSLGSSIAEGTVITKRTYKKNHDGSNGMLFVTFAMFKRESGYDPENGNWEYVKIPANADNNYDANPNGKLPAESNTDLRGSGEAQSGCISCHAKAAGNDYVFTNDE